jgi:hypothetical protein
MTMYSHCMFMYDYPDWGAFSSVVRQMPRLNPQRRGTARTLPTFCVVPCIFCVFYVFLCCSMYCLFCDVLCIVCLYCHRVATQLQLNISHHNLLWVQRRHNCSPAASFANCVMTLYLLKVHLETFLSIPGTQKCQIMSCDTLVANEWCMNIYLTDKSQSHFPSARLTYKTSTCNQQRVCYMRKMPASRRKT